MFARSILAITALISVAPLMAQSADKTDAAHVAADAQEIPQTQSLNNQVGGAIAQVQTVNDINQQQYAADKAAYEQAMRDHHREVLATDATYIRQREAYSLAMRDWRAQVEQCKRGYKKVCDLPAPDPMKYM